MADKEVVEKHDRWPGECHALLVTLKSTVERLLSIHTSNVWSTYGGFKRVCSHIEAILCHRIKVNQTLSKQEGAFWPFVRGLKWLRPGMTSTMDQVSRSASAAGQGGKGQVWLRESLQDHTLSSQLEVLVSDPQHLHYHYADGAFLQNEEYVTAMLICLRAVETNKVVCLSDINPKLLQPGPSGKGIGPNSRSEFQFSMSSDPSRLSCSSPDLHSLQTGDIYDEQGRDVSSPPAFYHSASSSTRSSLSASISADFSHHPAPQPVDTSGVLLYAPPTPLMEVEYGTSPPFRLTGPYHHRQSEDAFTQGAGGGDVNNRTFPLVGKGSSENFARQRENDNDGGEAETARGNSSNFKLVKKEVKEIHIPMKDALKKNGGGRAAEIRRQSSEAPKNGVDFKGGHKRSQSDMGVGGGGGGGVGRGLVKTEPRPVGVGGKLDPLPSHSGGSPTTALSAPATYPGNKSSQAAARVTLHRGDSIFQPPAEGQSLMSYLSEQDFNYCALLERENAHFGISDVLISVFEQMKWETSLRKHSLGDNGTDEESDEEINELKQRIRIRRRERLVEKATTFPANSDGMNDTNTASSVFTASSPLSSHGFSSCSDSSSDDEQNGDGDDGDEQFELTYSGTETSNLAKLRSSGLSLSLASLYSDAELKKSNQAADQHGSDRQSSEKSNFSAEAIAISLLSQFSEKRLPKASELEWLVSESDAPQALLPLPNSYPISPDDGEYADPTSGVNQTKLRGNLEWAPPRAQIIFTIHAQEKRSVVLSRQNMRCAGCGTKTEHAFVRRLRYCEYMGKYFCQCCHSNETAVVPGRVIQRWDSTRYYVSNFARDLLTKINTQPLFHVDAIHPQLYRRVRTLETVREMRQQLGHLHTLLNTCKRNVKWLEEAGKLPRHWWEDDNLYSMEDFSSVRAGHMVLVLKGLVSDAVSHVQSCPLCQGLGFICEICQGTDIIFPFQLSRITLCPVCQTCYHKSCYIPGKCPKCSRMELRRKRQTQLSPISPTGTEKIWDKDSDPVNSAVS